MEHDGIPFKNELLNHTFKIYEYQHYPHNPRDLYFETENTTLIQESIVGNHIRTDAINRRDSRMHRSVLSGAYNHKKLTQNIDHKDIDTGYIYKCFNDLTKRDNECTLNDLCYKRYNCSFYNISLTDLFDFHHWYIYHHN
jgi:hypothetical protein